MYAPQFKKQECYKQHEKSPIETLENIINNSHSGLEKAVAREALFYENEGIILFFEDLLQHGCISGMVTSLIYYCDTEAFFDKHYHEIMELKEEFEEK